MPRFLILGTGPLIDEAGARQVSGQCLRTVHFVRPMRAAGHEVRLLTVPIPGAEDARAGRLETADGIVYEALASHGQDAALARLREVLAAEAFDGAVGINAYPAYLLARALAGRGLPLWADLNGWTMAEGQTRAALVGHDGDMPHFWRLEAEVLLRADRFSTVSERQGDALYGELAMVGRLNRHTFDHPFAAPVPNAVHALYAGLERSADLPACLAGRGIAADAPLILWSGGFNTWTDAGLLTEALARVLETVPESHFVATGGAVTGHDDTTYRRFREMAAERLPAGRVHLLGWVPIEDVVALHARADVGLNVDAPNTETRFGARNRLTNMMGAGMAVVTTAGTEIAAWIAERDAGWVVVPRDAEALGGALAKALRDRDLARARAQRGQRAAREAFAPEATLTPFLSWCEKPECAPDRAEGPANPLAEWTRLQADGAVEGLLLDRASLRNLRAKWPLRLWRAAKGKFGRRS